MSYKTGSLEAAEIPASVSKIGVGVFNTSGIKKVTLPDTMKVIPDAFFLSCKNLAELNIPSELTEIGGSAFYDCTSLTALDLPKVEKVGASAFAACTALKSISFGAPLSLLEISAFADNESLESITVPAENEHFTTAGGALVCKDTKTAILLPMLSGVTSYVMPDYVEHIADYAFGKSETLEQIVLSPALKTIGYAAFHSDMKLARMVLPTSSADATFDLPKGITYVGGNAFGAPVEKVFTYTSFTKRLEYAKEI